MWKNFRFYFIWAFCFFFTLKSVAIRRGFFWFFFPPAPLLCTQSNTYKKHIFFGSYVTRNKTWTFPKRHIDEVESFNEESSSSSFLRLFCHSPLFFAFKRMEFSSSWMWRKKRLIWIYVFILSNVLFIRFFPSFHVCSTNRFTFQSNKFTSDCTLFSRVSRISTTQILDGKFNFWVSKKCVWIKPHEYKYTNMIDFDIICGEH